MNRASAILVASLTMGGCAASSPVSGPPLIPIPVGVTPEGGTFRIGPSTPILTAPGDAEATAAARVWATSLTAFDGSAMPVSAGACTRGAVCVRVGGPGAPRDAEAYVLHVTRDSAVVNGSDHAGAFYGLQTLAQLMPPGPAATASVEVGAVRVEDRPRFRWRGMHLDVGRHFFGPDFVKRYIDQLARYKLNRFHWHLTEDQGWRIQIRRYPKLTEIGSRRTQTMVEKNFDPFVGDGVPHGGYYTQDEIRDIVAYARERYVTIVPEIEMPGHSLAALAAYPELACTEGPFEVAQSWGVFDDIYCPKEETFAFLENVLAEVIELFPGEYVHVGGDEAPKTRWEASPVAQEVMAREGLADANALQSWFIRRIEAYLNRNGRRLIGWDEILEGGLAPNATVMSWRGVTGGIEAARAGHDVVMTPTSALYFDYYQGDPETEPLAIGGRLPLEVVYAYDPVPGELDASEARHVLGAQGNLWTEYLATEDRVEYMLFPRMLALAEMVWSPQDARDFADFTRRMPWHLDRLDAQGIDYRIPDVAGLERDRLTLDDRMEVTLSSGARGTIRTTLDGSEPTAASAPYLAPLRLDLRDGPVTVAARVVRPDGRLGPVRRARFEQAVPRPASLVDAALEPGLRVELLEGAFRRVADFRRGTSVRRDPVDAVVIPDWAPDETFGLRFNGYLSVPEDGVYRFRLTSDDGAVLRFAGTTVLDHDGPHTASPKEADVALSRGLHPIEVLYFQAGGGRALSLEMAVGDGPFEPLGGDAVLRVR